MEKCSKCGRNYYEGIIIKCPARPGKQYCIYCCRPCKACKKVDSGWVCEAERMMAEGKTPKPEKKV